MTTVVHLLCAGAARAVAEALVPAFEAESGARVEATYGAVGALRARMVGGAPCDVVVLTAALITNLSDEGRVIAETVAPVGRVPTSVAVRAGDAAPDIASTAALRSALLGADAIYFPDPERATAGLHFAGVLDRLGVRDAVAPRLRPFPNGATAMAELARAPDARAIGCTQATEILYTPGVALVGPLPAELALVTLYVTAVAAQGTRPALARRFVASLTGDATVDLRRQAGFDAATR